MIGLNRTNPLVFDCVVSFWALDARHTIRENKAIYRPEELDQQIADLLHQITKRFVAWGFWMVFHFLRKQGHPWNHKRVYRIWKAAGLNLRLPPKRPKIRRVYQNLLAPGRINEGWGVDFVSDWIVGPGQDKVRIINVIDEYSRKALWTEAYASISAKTMIEVLDKLIECRGVPADIRCDNGPEFISARLATWAEDRQIELKFIGSPTIFVERVSLAA